MEQRLNFLCIYCFFLSEFNKKLHFTKEQMTLNKDSARSMIMHCDGSD